MKPIFTKTYEFGLVEFYDDFLITVMNQGITVKPTYNNVLKELATTHFKGKSFGYITHRKNSYAVDPSIYIETSKIDNLVAFAVVSQKVITVKTVEVEKLFLEKPFKLFTELAEAIGWVQHKVATAK